MKSERGFTAFELVLVLLLIGILWLVQVKYCSLLSRDFKMSFEKSVAGSVQIGILTYFMDPHRGDLRAYPDSLDRENPGDCSSSKPCFGEVLPGGITSQWLKTGEFEYRGFALAENLWRYEPPSGKFYRLKAAG